MSRWWWVGVVTIGCGGLGPPAAPSVPQIPGVSALVDGAMPDVGAIAGPVAGEEPTAAAARLRAYADAMTAASVACQQSAAAWLAEGAATPTAEAVEAACGPVVTVWDAQAPALLGRYRPASRALLGGARLAEDVRVWILCLRTSASPTVMTSAVDHVRRSLGEELPTLEQARHVSRLDPELPPSAAREVSFEQAQSEITRILTSQAQDVGMLLRFFDNYAGAQGMNVALVRGRMLRAQGAASRVYVEAGKGAVESLRCTPDCADMVRDAVVVIDLAREAVARFGRSTAPYLDGTLAPGQPASLRADLVAALDVWENTRQDALTRWGRP